MRFLLLLILASSLIAQKLSLGIVVGGSPTDAFQNITNFAPVATNAVKAYSPAKDFVAGASVELRFNSTFSLETDALFRQLHLTQAQVLTGNTITPFGKTPVVTWEIPVLAKYRLPMQGIRPFIEGGPSFRTTGNLNNTQPSHVGVTAGAGVELQWRNLRIAPTIRYTRWQKDNPRYSPTLTNSDQIELVVGFSADAASHWRPLGRWASIGVIVGTNISADLQERHLVTPFSRGSTLTFSTDSGHRVIVGPTITFALPRKLSLEFDAIFHPIVEHTSQTIQSATPLSFPDQFHTTIRPTWEFPVLVKKSFTISRLHPFLGIGPAFRRPQGVVESYFGGVVAAGIELHWNQLLITPGVRFYRWGKDQNDYTQRNQSALLVGFSF